MGNTKARERKEEEKDGSSWAAEKLVHETMDLR